MREEELRLQTDTIAQAYSILSGRTVGDLNIKDFLLLRKAAIDEINAGFQALNMQDKKETPVAVVQSNQSIYKDSLHKNNTDVISSPVQTENIGNNDENSEVISFDEKIKKILSPYEELKLIKDDWN